MEDRNIIIKSCERKYKFLRRVLNLNPPDSNKVIIKSRLKGIYFKTISHKDKNCKFTPLKKKCLNFLTDLQLSSTCPASQEFIKNAKNLKDHKISIDLLNIPRTEDNRETIPILKHFSILPKNIQKIKIFFFDVSLYTQHLSQIYKRISCLKKLSTIQRDFDSLDNDWDEALFRKEYQLINQYLRHLRCLNEFEYSQNLLNQLAFNQMMKEDKVWPCVTTLKTCISGEIFEDFPDVENDLNEEASIIENDLENKNELDEEENEMLMNNNDDINNISEADNIEDEEEREGDFYSDNDSINDDMQSDEQSQSKHKKIQSLSDKVALFYKFNLFPKLQKLELVISVGCMIPLNAKIRNEFRSLNMLREFLLCFEVRPIGSKYIFEGIIDLPLLTFFALDTTFIREDEHILLKEFFKKQTQLVHLKISVSSERRTSLGYSQQNKILENIWQYLEEKPDLQCLCLESGSWPIQSLSKGLARAPTFKQLKSFSVMAFDDFMLSSEPPTQQIEGFLEFIRRHKKSLSDVTITIDPIIQSEIATSIVSTFYELEILKEVNLSLKSKIAINRKNFFDRIYPTKYRLKLKEKERNFEKIYPCLKKMLKALRKLVRCSVSLFSIENQIDTDTLIKLLKVSSEIESLEYLRFVFPTSEHTDIKEATYFQKLFPGYQKMPFFTLESANGISPKILTEELNKLNEKRSLRCDIMFQVTLLDDK